MTSPAHAPRVVTLLLCDRSGGLLRQRYAAEVAVLRMLPAGAESRPHGGPVTYLAELLNGSHPAGLTRWPGPDPTPDHPLRLPYARPGGRIETLDVTTGRRLWTAPVSEPPLALAW